MRDTYLTRRVFKQTKISKYPSLSLLFFSPPSTKLGGGCFFPACWRDIYNIFRSGGGQTLYSGSMSSSISFPVKVRTLRAGGFGLVNI